MALLHLLNNITVISLYLLGVLVRTIQCHKTTQFRVTEGVILFRTMGPGRVLSVSSISFPFNSDRDGLLMKGNSEIGDD